ncbi:MAG: oligoendopeptidase F [Coprococcus sp.]
MSKTLNGALPERKDVPAESKWHIEDIFASDAAFLSALDACREHIDKLAAFQGHLGDSADILYDYLSEKESVLIQLDSLFSYALQRSDENTSDPYYQDLKGRITVVGNHFSEVVAFEDPELLSLSKDYLSQAISSFPKLAPFAHYLEDTLRMKTHTLSKEEEALMSLTSDLNNIPQSIYYMFNNADIRFDSVTDSKGNEVAITHGRFVPLLESKDRDLREKVFKSYYHSFDQYKNTVAAMFSANLKKELFFTRARHYTSSMEAHLSLNNIPTSVYDQLIEAVHDALPEMYRYVRLRRRMLNVEELHMYDVYTPLVASEHDPIPFNEAMAIVSRGLAPLGEEYNRLLNEGMHGGWIDIYENKGKRTGAYSGGDYAHHPFVLLNYQGTLDNVFTLAHEMGHSLHSWYANHTHNYTNAQYCIFVAEIASTCNEALLMHDLLKRCTDPHEKLYLLNHYLDTFKGTLFRQTMFAEFEKIVHEKTAAGETLNAQALCKIYSDLNALYFGPDMINDPEIALEWARIPHFYRPFYVYQYATGFSAAIALSTRILKEGTPAVQDYINFLKAGGSDYPIEVLKKAGVNMTTKEPVANALKVFTSVLDEIEEIIEELSL